MDIVAGANVTEADIDEDMLESTGSKLESIGQ